MSTAPECIPTTSDPGSRLCQYCGGTFRPSRPWQAFCSAAHRTAFDKEFGSAGTVASVRRLRRGVSVVLHLDGPAAERALNLEIGAEVRIVRTQDRSR
ncbi:MAG TPA: hypothetical protein VJ738_01925 [Steroidobacteraceae bacterium]|nr:hypothetical protein [Steroidobacteraceae bacterium]